MSSYKAVDRNFTDYCSVVVLNSRVYVNCDYVLLIMISFHHQERFFVGPLNSHRYIGKSLHRRSLYRRSLYRGSVPYISLCLLPGHSIICHTGNIVVSRSGTSGLHCKLFGFPVVDPIAYFGFSLETLTLSIEAY